MDGKGEKNENKVLPVAGTDGLGGSAVEIAT